MGDTGKNHVRLNHEEREKPKKNRKVRRLRELHPELNVKIFYQKDFRALLARFGVTSEAQVHAAGGGFIARGQNGSAVDDEGTDGG